MNNCPEETFQNGARSAPYPNTVFQDDANLNFDAVDTLIVDVERISGIVQIAEPIEEAKA